MGFGGPLLGMNVELVDDVYNRLRASSARSTLTSASSTLRTMVNKTHNPSGFGLEPGDKVLTAYGVSLANSAITSMSRAITGLEDALSMMKSDKEMQATVSRVYNDFLKYGWNVIDDFLWYPKWMTVPPPYIVRSYGPKGNRTYGSLVRNPLDPRKGHTRGIAFSTNPYNSTNTWVSKYHNAFVKPVTQWQDKVIKKVTDGAANLINKIPSNGLKGAVKGATKFGARALGPIGIVVGAAFDYKDGYDTQVQKDQGKGYSNTEAELRAHGRGAIKAAASIAGGVALGALGAAVGGPVGAVAGAMLGSWLGGMAGDGIANWIFG